MSKKEIPEEIKEILFEKYNEGFISSIDSLYREAKETNYKVTKAMVKQFLDSLSSYQLTKQYVKNKQIFKQSRAVYPNEVIQTDIMYLPDTGNRKQKYMLSYVDVYSRKAFFRLLKTRDHDEIISAFESLFKEVGGPPKNLRFDNEFNKSVFLDFFAKHNIKIWPSKANDKIHQGIVERWHRTIRGMIKQTQNILKSNNKNAKLSDYIPLLPQIVENYNNRWHSTIKAIPAEVFVGQDQNHQQFKVVTFPFQPGDMVRMLEQRNNFDKKSSKNVWSKDRFIITRIVNGNYVVRNEKNKTKEEGPYRGNELVYAV